ncbi:hypothetical protein MMC25_000060 [Agyrium rufum]|nr:hypothetical protein [Agyrium rufum]
MGWPAYQKLTADSSEVVAPVPDIFEILNPRKRSWEDAGVARAGAKRQKMSPKEEEKLEQERLFWTDAVPVGEIKMELELGGEMPKRTAQVSEAVREEQPVSLKIRKSLAGWKLGTSSFELYAQNKTRLLEFQVPASIPEETTCFLQSTFVKRSRARLAAFLGRVNDTRCLLRIEVHWRNAISLSEGGSDKQNEYLYSLFPRDDAKETIPWAPRHFYESLHVPKPDAPYSEEIPFQQMRCQLYPFQRRAVHWLLERERAHGVDPEDCKKRKDLPLGFRFTTDLRGRPCYISPLLGIVTTKPEIADSFSIDNGSILAEEMGLGKTVEMLSLITQNTRILDMAKNEMGIKRSKTTLIITPPSIRDQWLSEIRRLTPLKVMVYDGIKNFHVKRSTEDIEEMLMEHDIVLATYNVLSSEIHYSTATPTRGLRHAQQYVRRSSPLTNIEWWRVVLDEAQMVESGVSNAARVAREIPRINAWAVSGTPVKENVKDLHGLLVFLRIEPFSSSVALWNRLVQHHKPILKQLFNRIALRHSKALVKDQIHLPLQKRMVVTLPFQQVEEQHYSDLFEEMCEDCSFDSSGVSLNDDQHDSNTSTVLMKMQTWLLRLRQNCLHPEVGTHNRRALGRKEGPLRSVADVLKIMIDQNAAEIRNEERQHILSQIRKGQAMEVMGRSRAALDLWQGTLRHSQEIVDEIRAEGMFEIEGSEDAGAALTRSSARLRSALELQHVSQFFVANAYFQEKELTKPESEEFQALERLEVKAYESAKELRKELLSETLSKAEGLIAALIEKKRIKELVKIGKFEKDYRGGLDSRDTLNRLEDLALYLNNQLQQLDEWRRKTVNLLILPLVDQDDDEIQGDEYELSTKQQEEVYVYVEVLRVLTADIYEVISGQTNLLVTHESHAALRAANKGEGHAPDLAKALFEKRNALKPSELGSIRAFLAELRTLKLSLTTLDGSRSTRHAAEAAIVDSALNKLMTEFNKFTKMVVGLEKEQASYRDLMNSRLDYYRQLQTVSDSVAPSELAELADGIQDAEDRKHFLNLHLDIYDGAIEKSQAKITALQGRGRYLKHLAEASSEESEQRQCIICKDAIEVGVLTNCGHAFDKECIRLWFNSHRNCPMCKTPLKREDFHPISYKPIEIGVQIEDHTCSTSPASSQQSGNTSNKSQGISIYSGMNASTLSQIQNIDLPSGISYGTKIDTIARHLLWLRVNDPDAKSVIFSQFKDFLEILGTAFQKFKIGFTSIDSKDGIERFKTDSTVDCFFLHAKAHSSGLNLVNAGHVFLCEPLINTALELQAIARVHRIGQVNETFVYMYIIENTVEKSIYDISVARRLAHVSNARGQLTTTSEKERKARKLSKNASIQETSDDTESESPNKNVSENDVDIANSLELQDAPLAKLLNKGSTAGEVVDKRDVWNCLFKNRPKLYHGLQEDERIEGREDGVGSLGEAELREEPGRVARMAGLMAGHAAIGRNDS